MACSGGGAPLSGSGGGPGGGDPKGPGGTDPKIPGVPGGGFDPSGGWGARTGPAGAAARAAFVARNDSAVPRCETLQVSIPFPAGAVGSLAHLGVRGFQTAWRVLMRWPDGSIRIAQAQFTDVLAPLSAERYEIAEGLTPVRGAFSPHPWTKALAPGFVFWVEVVDEDGVSYLGRPEGPAQVLAETPFVRTTFQRFYLRALDPKAGIGRDFLACRLYRETYAHVPFERLDLVVGNDYLGADDPGNDPDPNLRPLGPVSFKAIRFHVRGATVRLAERSRLGVPAPRLDPRTGFEVYELLGRSWLDDGQTLLYRFEVYHDHPKGAAAARARWRAGLEARAEDAVRPLADLGTWRRSGALGLFGGPAPAPTDAYARAEREWNGWRSRNHFGPFGSWGEIKATGTTGTPRNAPVSPDLVHAVQAEDPHLLEVLAGKARRQALRPYHMWGLRVGDEDGHYLWDGIPYRRGGRRLSDRTHGRWALFQNDPYAHWRRGVDWSRTAHGWNHYDEEHFTTDLLFDHYTVTGSLWARDELRMLGQCLKGLMRLRKFFTKNIQSARAEGWTMQSFVQCWLATGDDDLRRYALRRIHEVVEVQRRKTHASKALVFQWNHPLTKYPTPHAFFMPWQHAAVAYGYLAAWRFFGSNTARRIAEDVVTTVAYSWVRNYKDPKYGLVQDGLRYYVPAIYAGKPVGPDFFDSWPGIGVRWGDSPLGGAHEFLVSALYLIAAETTDPNLRAAALGFGSKLLGPIGPTRGRFWNKWAAVVPPSLVP